MHSLFTPSFILRSTAIVFLILAALGHHGYAYYLLTRWAVCCAAVLCTFVSREQSRRPWVVLFAVTAVVFNPVFPLHLKTGYFRTISIAAAVFLGLSLFFIEERRDS